MGAALVGGILGGIGGVGNVIADRRAPKQAPVQETVPAVSVTPAAAVMEQTAPAEQAQKAESEYEVQKKAQEAILSGELDRTIASLKKARDIPAKAPGTRIAAKAAQADEKARIRQMAGEVDTPDLTGWLPNASETTKPFERDDSFLYALNRMQAYGEDTPYLLPQDWQIAEEAQKNTAGEADGSIRVGKVSKIKNPYNGQTPVQTTTTNKTVEIGGDALATAKEIIATAISNAKRSGLNIKTEMRHLFQNTMETSNGTPVYGMNFNGERYFVAVGKKVPGKLISDPNFSAEKMSVLSKLRSVIKNATYVGSGVHEGDGIRYDYFETDITINGKPYVAAFDVEVLPGTNNYRTHKIVNMELMQDTTSLVGPVPTASVNTSTPNVTLPQPAEKVKNNRSTEGGVMRTVNGQTYDVTTEEGAKAALEAEKAQAAEQEMTEFRGTNGAPAGSSLEKLGVNVTGDQGDYRNVAQVRANEQAKRAVRSCSTS